ncbi:Crp/Fnr family transcriptional regulator [Palleronia sp. KMU-117]|uniref:Crp/Fnr family transcriptional regulator n=1 Tax=Palleronia sp. KMU-117 TaxID=3434108 RepID=UPI003D7544F9
MFDDNLPHELRGHRSRLHQMLELLAPQVRDDLLQTGLVHRFSEGEVVVPEGVHAERIGYVLDGALGMQKRLSDGRTHLIGLLVPTDMYGRVFDGESGYDLVALSETRAFSFPRDAFEEAMGSSPEVERRFLVSLLDELDAAREWILLLGGHKVIERVASFLLVMLRRTLRAETGHGPAGAGAGGKVLKVRIPIRRKDLAHHLGARSESISRALHELEDRGTIVLEDAYTVRVTNVPALVEVSGVDLIVDDL